MSNHEIVDVGVRKIDSLGRMVLQQEARRALGIEPDDYVQTFIDKNNGEIILRKYTHESAVK